MIRRASFADQITYLKCTEDNMFIVSKGTIHVLNMHGFIVNDVKFPSGIVEDISKFESILFVRTNKNEYYYFRLGDTEVGRLRFLTGILKAGESLAFFEKNSLCVLQKSTADDWCRITLPSEIVGFAELSTGIYILFENHFCVIRKPLCSNKKLVIEQIECLSHLSFSSVDSNGKDILVLESTDSLVMYDGDVFFWLLKKPKNYIRYELSWIFLSVFSDIIELYNLREKTRLARFCTRTHVASYDFSRKKLWVYSDMLYEIDIAR